MSLFRASVSAGESGPVITLYGETDMSTVAELSELVTGQLAGGTRHLTVDVGGLDFADTGSIRVFLLAARTLRQRGGDLVLLRPQRTLARVLEIIGAEEAITIRGVAAVTAEPKGDADGAPEASPQPSLPLAEP